MVRRKRYLNGCGDDYSLANRNDQFVGADGNDTLVGGAVTIS
jgi:hypothetical protein